MDYTLENLIEIAGEENMIRVGNHMIIARPHDLTAHGITYRCEIYTTNDHDFTTANFERTRTSLATFATPHKAFEWATRRLTNN